MSLPLTKDFATVMVFAGNIFKVCFNQIARFFDISGNPNGEFFTGSDQAEAIDHNLKEVYNEFILWEVTHPSISSFSYYLPLAGDVNNDGKVDIRDIATVARAYGSQPGDWY